MGLVVFLGTLLALTSPAAAVTTSVLTATGARMTGDAGADMLRIESYGGRDLLRHNRFAAGDPGYASELDFDTTRAGIQPLSKSAPGTLRLRVNLGGGADTFTLFAQAGSVPAQRFQLWGDRLGIASVDVVGGARLDQVTMIEFDDSVEGRSVTTRHSRDPFTVMEGGVQLGGGQLRLTNGWLDFTPTTEDRQVLALPHGAIDIAPFGLVTGARRLTMGGGDDLVVLAQADLVLDTGAGDDLVPMFDQGGAVRTGAGNDTVVGGAGPDEVWMHPGWDVFDSGEGDDIFHGDTSADRFDIFAACGGRDTITYEGRTLPVQVRLRPFAALVGEPVARDDIGEVERVIGGSGNDTLVGTDAAEEFQGGGGADLIRGGDGNDTVRGGPGDDRMVEDSTRNGRDVLDGQAGQDTVSYAQRSGPVRVRADGIGRDGQAAEGDNVLAEVIIGGRAGDVLEGEAGTILLAGGPGDDRLLARNSTARLEGGAGDDVVNAQNQLHNELDGGRGRDVVMVDEFDVYRGEEETILVVAGEPVAGTAPHPVRTVSSAAEAPLGATSSSNSC